MKRLIEYTVFSGFVTACRLATCPTRRSPDLVMATTEGVVRVPSWLGITTGSPPCITATTELVVPKSIPIILLIAAFSFPNLLKNSWRRHSHRNVCCPSSSPMVRWLFKPAVRLPSQKKATKDRKRGAVYMLSVSLSSCLILAVSYCAKWPYERNDGQDR